MCLSWRFGWVQPGAPETCPPHAVRTVRPCSQLLEWRHGCCTWILWRAGTDKNRVPPWGICLGEVILGGRIIRYLLLQTFAKAGQESCPPPLECTTGANGAIRPCPPLSATPQFLSRPSWVLSRTTQPPPKTAWTSVELMPRRTWCHRRSTNDGFGPARHISGPSCRCAFSF